MPKKKHQPPAKAKYDKAHPVLSIRLNAELKQKLEEIKNKSGKSVADVLKEAIGVQAESVNDAFARGFLSAQYHHSVFYKCSGCGGTIEIRTAEEKKAVAQYMQEHGWGHVDCIKS